MPHANWKDGGFAGIALTDNLLRTLVRNGVLSADERREIIDGAIADLSSAGGEVARAADTLHAIFQRS